MKKSAVLLLLLLGGCATASETVYLARTDGQRAQCGPYSESMMAPGDNQAHNDARLRQCVRDYQMAGYERVAN